MPMFLVIFMTRTSPRRTRRSQSNFLVYLLALCALCLPRNSTATAGDEVVLRIEAQEEIWPLKEPFRISRGSRTEARVIVVTVTDGKHTGRGEGVPLARYGQSVDSVLAQIESMKREKNLDRRQLQKLLPAGAARNALDCALWDLEAKISGKRVWELANIPSVAEVETSFTISLDTPEKMAASAQGYGVPGPLKLKLGGDKLDLPRVEAVREVAPKAPLLIDANESW